MSLKISMFLAIGLLSACGKKSSGSKITTTRVRPPVQESMPAKLLTSGSYTLAEGDVDYTQTCQTDAAAGDKCTTYTGSKQLACIVKQRLFCKGPTEVLTLLDGLDSRLAEIESRSAGATCIDKAVTDLSSQLSYPGNTTFTFKAFCQDSSIKLGFGQENGIWYLREANGAMAQSFSVTPENVVEGYMWLPSKDGTLSQSTGLLKIHADKANKTFEMTGGGVGIGFCGMHLHSNATNIYLIGNPDMGHGCDFNQDNTADASDWVEICMKSDDMSEVAVSTCADLKSGLKLKTHTRAATTTASGTVWEAAAAAPTGLTAVTFELKDYLNDLFTKAGTYTDVEEFKSSSN